MAGEVHVFAGRRSWPASIDLAVDTADLRVIGELNGGLRGEALARSLQGDWDGDGQEDLILGALSHARSATQNSSGAIHILRGGPGLRGTIDLETQPADWPILGPRRFSALGHQLRFGDVNGDRFPDIVSGAFGADTPYARRAAGAVVTIAGCDSPQPFRDLLVEPPELAIYGAEARDRWGGNVVLGDLDGDGLQDIIAGARSTDGPDNLRPDAGSVHIILGRPTAPACTVTPDPGLDQTACAGISTTLDGSATTVTSCSVSPQFRWMSGSTVVSGWSAVPTVVVTPFTDTTYRLEVRCGDCAGPCFAAASADVTVTADPLPPDQGNVLRAVHRGPDVRLEFARAPATGWRLYRDPDKRSLGTTALSPDVSVPSFDDRGATGRATDDYYRVKGLSPCTMTPGP